MEELLQRCTRGGCTAAAGGCSQDTALYMVLGTIPSTVQWTALYLTLCVKVREGEEGWPPSSSS